MNSLFWLVPVGSIVALLFAFIFLRQVQKTSPGDDKMVRIARAVKEGAMAYLKQQYKVIAIFSIFVAIFFAFLAFILKVQSPWLPFAFLSGGFFSALAGYVGMRAATSASSRTTQAAKKSLNSALRVAFRSGAVIGLVVVGLALLNISIWFFLLRIILNYSLSSVTSIILGSSIGASFYALFARVGGGIYTKSADVGADLVGKVEAGIPEDDPRNPAVIADQVGDNVGDVAGMGADLFESYYAAIMATAVLGVAAGLGLAGIIVPMLIAVVGIISSIAGIYLVRAREDASQKNLLNALSRGINFSALLIIVLSGFVIYLLLPKNFGIFGSMFVGLLVGIIIGKSTEFFTSSGYSPTRRIAQASKTGPATVIIEGFSTGMFSTWIPVAAVCTGTILSFWLAGGFTNPSLGLYGIGIAAVGMLSTLGITLASDAYGPIADNAGGNAEMTHQNPEVRKKTDALDALGNTTAATGKGFAIGSAALTALALVAAYIEEVRIGLERAGFEVLKIGQRIVLVKEALPTDFMQYFEVYPLSPKVVVGLMIGAMLTFIFCSSTLKAVGRTAGKMIEEVRRQWKEIKGIMNGQSQPDYASCVKIVTKAAQREMIFPSFLAIIGPIVIGLILGVAGVVGLLVGSLSTGFILAVTMANAGGAWDNAKKYIEEGHFGGKGSERHKAAVIGDMLGDPFKDTAGPSLNILIKLMSMVSIVVAGFIVVYHLF